MAKDDDEIARVRAAKQGSPFLNTEQAAAYLGLSARKLQYMRSRCTGPRYRLHSRFVRYHIDDLIFWSRSTSPATDAADHAPEDRTTDRPGTAPDRPEEPQVRAADAASPDRDRGDV